MRHIKKFENFNESKIDTIRATESNLPKPYVSKAPSVPKKEKEKSPSILGGLKKMSPFGVNQKLVPLFQEIKSEIERKYPNSYREPDENGAGGEYRFYLLLPVDGLQKQQKHLILSYDYDTPIFLRPSGKGNNFYVRTTAWKVADKFNFEKVGFPLFVYEKKFKFEVDNDQFNNRVKQELFQLLEDIFDPNSEAYAKYPQKTTPKSDFKSSLKKWFD
jgi:hypothetical protein